MADFDARLLTDSDHAEWAALWERSRRLLVQHPGFAACASPRFAAAVGVWGGGALVMAVPFHRLEHRRLTHWLTPLFAPFCGPLVDTATTALTGAHAERFWRGAFEALAAAIPSGPDRVEMILPPGCQDARGLVWKGWEARPHYTYVSKWDEPGGWREALEGSVRRQERKALAAGLTTRTRPATEAEELAALWRANAPRSRQDAALAEPLAALAAWLGSENRGFIAEVRDAAQDRCHAAALVGFDGERVYYLAGAADPALLGSGAPTLLQTAILGEIDRRGLVQCYDWVGANAPDVARFKRHFGPRVELLVAAARQGRRARVLETGRRLLRP